MTRGYCIFEWSAYQISFAAVERVSFVSFMSFVNSVMSYSFSTSYKVIEDNE